MTREALVFSIRYSFYLETMQAALYNRIDRLLNFAQIMLGSAIFAAYGSLTMFGAVVTAISAISFVWQPGKTAMLCELQSRAMKKLISLTYTAPDEQLNAEFLRAQEGDSPSLGLLRDAAHKRTLISLGRSQEASTIRMSFVESAVAWFAGDLPKDV